MMEIKHVLEKYDHILFGSKGRTRNRIVVCSVQLCERHDRQVVLKIK